MANKTLLERYTAYFEAHQYKPVPMRSKKYICFKSPITGRYYLLGKNGSVRVNSKAVVEGSLSLTIQNNFKQKVELWEAEQGGKV